MKKLFLLLIGSALTTLSVNGQEIIPFPDLSEHYNFRNTGGEGTAANSYDHLEENYRKALESLDKEISLMEDRLLEIDAKDKEVLQRELEGLRSKRSALKEEAELQADLLNFF